MIVAPFDNLASTIQSLIDGGSISVGAEIEVGSYVGTGVTTHSATNPAKLTFNKPPKFVRIFYFNNSSESAKNGGFFGTFFPTLGYGSVQRDVTNASYAFAAPYVVTLNGNTMEWYTVDEVPTTNNDFKHLQQGNLTYYYVAIC